MSQESQSVAEQDRSSEPRLPFSAQRRAAVRECLVPSTVPVGGGRSPLALTKKTLTDAAVGGWPPGGSLPSSFRKYCWVVGRAQFACKCHSPLLTLHLAGRRSSRVGRGIRATRDAEWAGGKAEG